MLLAVAGFNFARFQLGIAGRAVRVRGILAAVAAFAIPAMLWIAASGVVTGSYRPATALLLNGVLGGDTWTDDWRFWFVEALVWIYVGGAVLLGVPALDRWQRRWPFGTSLVVLGVALLARFAITGIEAGATGRYSIALVLWCFALGWAAAVAHTTPRRVLVGVLAAASTFGFFGDLQREAIVVLGVVALLWRGTPRLPAPAAVLVRLVASASLWIYLTHWQVYPVLEGSGHPFLAIVASLVVGVAAWRTWLVVSGRFGVWRAALTRRSRPTDQESADSPAATAKPRTAARPALSLAFSVASGIIEPTSMTSRAPAAKPSTAASNRSSVTSRDRVAAERRQGAGDCHQGPQPDDAARLLAGRSHVGGRADRLGQVGDEDRDQERDADALALSKSQPEHRLFGYSVEKRSKGERQPGRAGPQPAADPIDHAIGEVEGQRAGRQSGRQRQCPTFGEPFLGELEGDAGDQRAGTESEDDADQSRRPLPGDAQHSADDQRGRGKYSPAQCLPHRGSSHR